MTVYVDDSRTVSGRVYVLSLMLADTDKELEGMAATLGLDAAWRKPAEGGPDPRYYVSPGLRVRAIKLKAREITAAQALAMRRRRHHTGALGNPADALAWAAANPPQASDTQSQEGNHGNE